MRRSFGFVVRIVETKEKRGTAHRGSELKEQIILPIGDRIFRPSVAQLRLEIAGPSYLIEPIAVELVCCGGVEVVTSGNVLAKRCCNRLARLSPSPVDRRPERPCTAPRC